MRKHHEEAVAKLSEYFRDDLGVLAVILGGSVAKGLEHPKSDIDAMVAVTDARYAELARDGRLAECVWGVCGYEGGYFDIKYCDRDYLASAAARGSEPTRNAFVKARCLWSRDPSIEELVPKIGVFQDGEAAEKMSSFHAAFTLNHGYLWSVSAENRYLRVRAASDIALFGCRMLLQEARVLFPCHKALMDAVGGLARKPDGIEAKADRMLRTFDDDAKNDFVSSILGFIEYRPPEEFDPILTRFVRDHEQWWWKERPVIAEW